MPLRWRRRPGRRRKPYSPLLTPDEKGRIILSVLIIGILLILVRCSLYLKELSASMALSDAGDLVTMTINETINRKVSDGNYDYDYFVSLEKDEEGNITAIKTNMARINSFSSQVLQDVVAAFDSGRLNINIPLGNLLGTSLTLGKGPNVPVDIIMLTSSYTDYKNELISAGINQTRHQIKLEVVVDIDILVPWDTMSTQVVSEALIAETIIVGKVPETYVDTEKR